ncbi:MAG: hypothetical protein Q8K65_10890 [Alphaproteobacteria bacterium]|jgi:uncharacterized protein YjbJ (UPF0337 family)|nr:hypothetical protein [Alphaproteobacteria bacterium]
MTNNKEQNKAATPEVKTSAGSLQQNNPATDKSTQDKAGMIKTEIKKAWNKLTDEDVSLYETQPEQFFASVKDKHGFSREQTEKRLENIKETCGSACSSVDKKSA